MKIISAVNTNVCLLCGVLYLPVHKHEKLLNLNLVEGVDPPLNVRA
jgi:hypothetical protein